MRSPEKRLDDSERGARGAPESLRGPLNSRGAPESLRGPLNSRGLSDLLVDLPVDARPSDGRLSRRLSSFEILFLIMVQHHCWNKRGRTFVILVSIVEI